MFKEGEVVVVFRILVCSQGFGVFPGSLSCSLGFGVKCKNVSDFFEEFFKKGTLKPRVKKVLCYPFFAVYF